MTLPPERDFKLIIAEIEESGVTLYKLSLMIGKQLHLVRRWKFGAKPKHHEGEALIAIHAEFVPLSKVTHRKLDTANRSDNI